MILQQTFYNCLCTGKRKRVSEAASIKSAAAFQAILTKERARVDRNSHVFSLVAFEVGPQDSCMHSINNLVSQLKKQIRITDEIGWLDNGSIGVLLFNALSEEANLFIEKIKRNCPPNILCKCFISTYPEGMVEHPHNEEIHRGLEIPCHPGSTSLHEHHSHTDDQIGLSLQPVFTRKIPIWKRCLDILGALVGLIVLSPLFMVIGLFIKIASPGPVFFKQERIGYGGASFVFFKFRTMMIDNDTSTHQKLLADMINSCEEDEGIPMTKMDDDPRIAPLGKFLRQTCLDELPQLINVLKGEMSLVGPRPPITYEVEEYDQWHNDRFDIIPGMTGLWQVSGKNRLTFKQMIRADIDYSRKMSLLFDLKILMLTPLAIFQQIYK